MAGFQGAIEMIKKDLPEFAQCMTALALIFNEELKAEKVELYFGLLKEYEIGLVKNASDRLGRTLKFFPKPADFIEAIDGTIEEKASKAWYDYKKALDRPGPYKSLNIFDPFAHAAIQDMDLWGSGIERNGYPDQRADEDFIRQEFIRRYKIRAKHTRPEHLPMYLPGVYEEENRKKIAAGEHLGWSEKQIDFIQKNFPSVLPEPKKAINKPEDDSNNAA
jgi:hypothetical protein